MLTTKAQGGRAIGEILAGAGGQGDVVLLSIPVDHQPTGTGRREFEFSFGQAGTRPFGALPLHLGEDIRPEHTDRLVGVAIQSSVDGHPLPGSPNNTGQEESGNEDGGEQKTCE